MTRARAGLRLLERPLQVEASLWRRLRFEQDRTCRERLFERYSTFARSISRQELHRRPAYGLDRTDFDQLAFEGLLESIDHYDPVRGVPFTAFARHRIKGAITDGIARSSEDAAQFQARRRLERERMQSLLPPGKGGADPVAELADLATALAIGLIAQAGSLDGPSAQASAYDSIAWRDMQLRVLEEIDNLASPEKVVLQQHYLNDVPFTQIAKLLNLTKGRIAQIHRAALQRLRGRLKSEG